MLDFILILLLTALAQISGGIVSWFFIKKFCKKMKEIILIEISLMLVVSILLIIEGLNVTLLSGITIVIGAGIIHVLNKIIPHKHHTSEAEKVGFLVFIAMCFHEFPEGIAFGSSYVINPYLGTATAILIALHNIPEGSIVCIPYFMKKKFIKGLKAVSVTQLLYILGGLVSYFLLVNIPEQFQAMAVTFAAGAMLYIIYEEILWMKK